MSAFTKDRDFNTEVLYSAHLIAVIMDIASVVHREKKLLI